MKLSSTLFLAASTAFLLSSCGQQNKAETLVSDFVDENTTLAGCKVECAPIDSTNRITPQRLAAMAKNSAADPLFKAGTTRSLGTHSDDVYIYTRAKLINGTDTAYRTFYLDKALTKVVAFKEN